VVGWVLSYLSKAAMTGFVGIDAESSSEAFDVLLANSGGMLF